jgi:hypothetical protein
MVLICYFEGEGEVDSVDIGKAVNLDAIEKLGVSYKVDFPSGMYTCIILAPRKTLS